MLESLLAYPDFWKYVSIPFIAGAVGWTTNWMAVQMTFYPLEFLGIRPFFGWQGIIPSKGEKMARKSVQLMTTQLINVREQFDKIDPDVRKPPLGRWDDPSTWVEGYPQVDRQRLLEKLRHEGAGAAAAWVRSGRRTSSGSPSSW